MKSPIVTSRKKPSVTMRKSQKAGSNKRMIPRSSLIFIFSLLTTGFILIGWASVRMLTPRRPMYDLASDAKAYLRSRNVVPLAGSLEQLLDNPEKFRVASQGHPLLNQLAPSFELPDHQEKPHRLSELTKSGPVVVMFYYGYWCNHCVGQLFALNDDFESFRKLGATVVAISADPPEQTRERFIEFGAFKFPVLSDKDSKIAEAFGVYEPATAPEQGRLLHGTFLVDRGGRVRWCQFGDEPFTNNRALLIELSKMEDRLAANQK